jgi:hypothetical protein
VVARPRGDRLGRRRENIKDRHDVIENSTICAVFDLL